VANLVLYSFITRLSAQKLQENPQVLNLWVLEISQKDLVYEVFFGSKAFFSRSWRAKTHCYP
jgi:hypothetical protein